MYAPIPDGQVNILRGVPLDSDYKHTIYFASEGAQSAYFAGKQKHSYTSMMYIRETGRIRVPIAADSLFDCNYLMYKNQQYLNKWFYAFINQVYYVNDNCAEIEFQIDVLQTWLFNIDLKPSFIERQHTTTDVIGENTVPEPINVNRYHLHDSYSTIPAMFQEWDVVMYATFDPTTYGYYGGDGNNGIWSGLDQTPIGKVRITNSNGVISYNWITSPRSILTDLITNHADEIGGVVAIVMRPSHFSSNPTNSITINKPQTLNNLHNKKCLTYPFTKLVVTDGNGGQREYAFEEFTGNATEAHFFINSDRAPNESIVCTPTLYRGIVMDITQSIVLSGFPQCSWVSDSFQTYLANNQSNMMLTGALAAGQLIGGAALTATGGGSAVGIGMVASGLTQVAGLLAGLYQATKLPNQAHGSVTNSSFFTQGKKGFEFFTMVPFSDDLRIIDEFFDLYGYSIHRVQTPNLAARPHWTFIKTVDACILPKTDGLPASDLKEICKIFDRGITWWRNGSEVGNYNLDNSV